MKPDKLLQQGNPLMLIAGVDEAGRGCVIGPLVVAGISVKEENIPKLMEIGVKDSKLLSPRKREILSVETKKIIEKCSLVKLSPQEIDAVVGRHGRLRRLNWLEARAMAKVIEQLKPHKAYVDAADVFERRFKEQICEFLPFKLNIVSEHKADRNYPVVSAASIIAKVERDKEIHILRQIHGDFGSGYPSDPKTLAFLKRSIERLHEYPDFVRKSWRPAKEVKSFKGMRQTRLM